MSVRRRTTRRRRGFTIIEMLIVVVMMAALAAISLGKSSSIMTNWRVSRAAQAWTEELQLAFALVGRNRKPVIIEFRTDSLNLTIRSRTDAAGNTTIFHRRNFGMDSEYRLTGPNMLFSKDSLAATPRIRSIEVYPPGLASDTFAVTITKNGISKRLRLLRGGLVQICYTADPTLC